MINAEDGDTYVTEEDDAMINVWSRVYRMVGWPHLWEIHLRLWPVFIKWQQTHTYATAGMIIIIIINQCIIMEHVDGEDETPRLSIRPPIWVSFQTVTLQWAKVTAISCDRFRSRQNQNVSQRLLFNDPATPPPYGEDWFQITEMRGSWYSWSSAEDQLSYKYRRSIAMQVLKIECHASAEDRFEIEYTFCNLKKKVK